MMPIASTDGNNHITSRLPLPDELSVVVGQCSESGMKSSNDDAIGIRIPDGMLLTTKGVVSVICDGVSTAEAGAKASAISVSNFLADYYSTPETWTVETSSARVLSALNRWLYGLGQDYRDARKGYVCTFTALILKSCSAHLFHIGDSRLYRYRDGELVRMSQDHATNIGKHQAYLTRALGMDVNLDVDYRQWSIKKGDYYVLSTDGVHDALTDFEIKQMLARLEDTPINDAVCERWCDSLVKRALVNGSQDNLSCQLIYIASLPSQQLEDVYARLANKPFPPPMSVGMMLDGYQVRQVLHQSQRSQVYLVHDPQGRALCMKTPSVNYLDDAAYIERFMLEGWIGSRVNNSHVIKVLDGQKPKSALYYLTEYLPGITLKDWLKQYPTPPVEDVLNLVTQIELGIRAFHRQEVLHHDLKPDNIFITAEHQVKIIDFGACQIKGLQEISTPLIREARLGTVEYSAPEVLLGQPSDGRSDLFSLAVVTYEMLTGRLPFDGRLAKCRHPKDYLRLHYVAVHELNPMVPEWLDQPIRKALMVDPSRRQADTHEFVFELTHAKKKVKPKSFTPLMAKDPVKFWQWLGVVQLCVIIYLWLYG